MLEISEFRARPGYVIIKPAQERQKTEGGVYLSDWTEKRQTHGQVVSIGAGVDGLEEGDWVLFLRWAGEHLSDREEFCYVVVRAKDVQAVINGSQMCPCGDWVAVRTIDERVTETESGLVIAQSGFLHYMGSDGQVDSVRQDEVLDVPPPNRGTVMAVGPGCSSVVVGEVAILPEWMGTEVNLAGTEYLMVRAEQILACAK